MNWKRLLWILAGLFALWWIISDPNGAAGFVQGVVAFFRHAGTSIATFFSHA